MLRLEAIEAGYGPVKVLRGITLDVAAGEITCLLGRNGAGKTTTVRTVMGMLPLMAGRIALGDTDLGAEPAHRRAAEGVGLVPQGRRLFPDLTVAQNLEMGLLAGPRGGAEAARRRALALFPRLEERMRQRARSLSGGEQQMLAMARAMCLSPRLLLLDEPTEGLQPSMIETIRAATRAMRDEGTAVLLVESRVDAVLPVADRVAFIENGTIAETCLPEELRTRPELLKRYLGV